MHTRISTCSGCLSILYIKWLVWVDHEVVDPSSSVSMERGLGDSLSPWVDYSDRCIVHRGCVLFPEADINSKTMMFKLWHIRWLNCNEPTSEADSRYTSRYLYWRDNPPLFYSDRVISHMCLADNAKFSGPSLRIVHSQDQWLAWHLITLETPASVNHSRKRSAYNKIKKMPSFQPSHIQNWVFFAPSGSTGRVSSGTYTLLPARYYERTAV